MVAAGISQGLSRVTGDKPGLVHALWWKEYIVVFLSNECAVHFWLLCATVRIIGGWGREKTYGNGFRVSLIEVLL
jgi:hypothetical protein